VLQELVKLDAIAAARFASVFRGFDSAEDYARFFDKEVGRGQPPSEGEA
jgi:transcriptional regulator NrdR family protein